MSAFDQALEVSKMGSIYRGGLDGGKPSYFALDPEVAVAYALGRSLWEYAKTGNEFV